MVVWKYFKPHSLVHVIWRVTVRWCAELYLLQISGCMQILLLFPIIALCVSSYWRSVKNTCSEVCVCGEKRNSYWLTGITDIVVWMCQFSLHLSECHTKIQVENRQSYIIKQEFIYIAFMLNGYLFYEMHDWRNNRALKTSQVLTTWSDNNNGEESVHIVGIRVLWGKKALNYRELQKYGLWNSCLLIAVIQELHSVSAVVYSDMPRHY